MAFRKNIGNKGPGLLEYPVYRHFAKEHLSGRRVFLPSVKMIGGQPQRRRNQKAMRGPTKIQEN